MAKNKSPQGICDVALTSLLMKTFENLIKRELVGADAVLTLLNLILKHLEGPGTHACTYCF